MSMFCNWCMNSKCLFLINEVFFFLLTYFFWKQNDVWIKSWNKFIFWILNEWKISVFDVLFAFVLLFLNFILSVISRIFRALFACLIYFWKISTKFRIMIRSLIMFVLFINHQIVLCFCRCFAWWEKTWNWLCVKFFMIIIFWMHISCFIFWLFVIKFT